MAAPLASRPAPPLDGPRIYRGQRLRECRGCGGPIQDPRRRAWCSRACVDARLAQSRPHEAVWRRDRGVCARCGLDCEALRAWTERIRYHLRRAWVEFELGGECAALAAREGWLGAGSRVSYWDADHIEGYARTGHVGLDGLQTLCIWCHAAKTREQRRTG